MEKHREKMEGMSDVDDQRLRAAYHEAGHAVAAIGLGVPFRNVVVPPAPEQSALRKDSVKVLLNGYTSIAFRKNPTPQQAFDEVRVLVAGTVAECILLSRRPGSPSADDLVWLMIGANDDLVHAVERLRKVSNDGNHVGDALMSVKQNFEVGWLMITRVADALLAKGELSVDEVGTIVEETARELRPTLSVRAE